MVLRKARAFADFGEALREKRRKVPYVLELACTPLAVETVYLLQKSVPPSHTQLKSTRFISRRFRRRVMIPGMIYGCYIYVRGALCTWYGAHCAPLGSLTVRLVWGALCAPAIGVINTSTAANPPSESGLNRRRLVDSAQLQRVSPRRIAILAEAPDVYSILRILDGRTDYAATIFGK